MAVYLTLTVLVVLLGIFADNRAAVQHHISPNARTLRYGGVTRGQALTWVACAAVFVLLAGVSACRIAVGNDYWVYREQFTWIMHNNRQVSYEFGFRLSVWIIQSIFGYDNYLAVFGVFSIVTCYFFVRSLYDQCRWMAAGIFLLMTGGYYFSSLNSVRYYFVLAIAMYAMKYVLRKEYGKFILWICFAACFHKSILVVIPVYLAAGWLSERKLPRWTYPAAGVFVASLLLFPEFYRRIIFTFYPYYENSVFDNGDVSYTNIAKAVGAILLALLFYRQTVREDRQNRFYLLLNVMGLITYAFASFIPEISRIGYYFIVSQVFLLPGILADIPQKRVRRFFIVCVGLAFTAYFGLFLRDAWDVNVRLLPYLNWIFN
ncbi:MAG: EpsG family protein [Lachnospiraceae bacterium]|nr:EpsG family protein [Lachnospiraceae bacterium]